MNINHVSLLASIGPNLVNHASFFLLYLGPETVLPVASILAAVLGFLLIFWRLILRGVKKALGLVFARFRNSPSEEAATVESPADTSEEI